MAATDWQKLKQDAAETIQDIVICKLTKDAYILLGASFAILDHQEPNQINISTFQEKPEIISISHPTNKPLHKIVEDELSDAEMYYGMGEYEIAKDELRHADRFLAVLKAQPNKPYLQSLL